MRFFAHDGKTVHGPAVPEELLQLPGFDGATLVCPVGSENSADWKPALAYPPFREALLAPGPKLMPLSPPPPAAPPPAPTAPCPRCARPNTTDAVYCNACASRMDGRAEPPGPKRAMANAREPEPEAPFIAADPVAEAPWPDPSSAEIASAEVSADIAPAPAAASPWRKPLIASFAGAVLASGALGWWMLRPAKRAAPPEAAAVLQPAAAAAPPAASPPPAAVAAAALTPASAAPPTAVPPTPAAPKKPARRIPRSRKPKPAPESTVAAPSAGTAPTIGAKPAARPPAAAASAVMMPGVPRPVAPKSPAKPASGAAPEAAKTEAEGSGAAEDETSRQVREQFVFCAQLLAQGAYADHFDTCLCADARQAPPYRGRRESYAAAMKKAAAAGTLETSAAITGIVLDGPVAKVTADWKAGDAGMTRTETESWQLDDGLWCRSP